MGTILKTIAAFFENLLGVDEEAKKADMYLSNHALGLALSAFLAVFILIAKYITEKEWFYLVLSAAFLFIFIGILLCYKNQRIYIISDEEFVYSTMFGRKRIYRFEQISALRKNRDSLTLFIGSDKVHIEASAVMSERLKRLIIHEFEKKSLERNEQTGNT